MQELFLVSLLFVQAAAQPPATSITGRILFSDGMPASGLVVQAVPVSEVQDPGLFIKGSSLGRTDGAGAYKIQLAAGSYYLRIRDGRGGFTYYPGVPVLPDAAVVRTTDTPIENLNFALPEAASGIHVSGHVTLPPSQSGRRAGMAVQLSGPTGPLTVPIDPAGAFDIPHVMPGGYRLSVEPAPGLLPIPLVVASTDIRNLELVVPRLVMLAGTVVTDGGAIPRFTIAVESVAYRTNINVGTDGKFQIELPEGRYRMVLALGDGYYLKTLESGKTDLQTEMLQIAETDSAVAVKIALAKSPGVRVTGHVTVSGPGAPSSSMRSLTFTGRAVNQSTDVKIAPDGSFEIPEIVPGAYVARVTLASMLSSPVVPVSIPNRELRDLVIEIPPEVEVWGRVDVDGYGPPPRFSLTLINGEVPLTTGKNGELPSLSAAGLFEAVRGGTGGSEVVEMKVSALPDGAFKMKLPEGTYHVAAATRAGNGVPPAYVLRSMTYGSADLLKEPLKISSEAHPELQIGFEPASPSPWLSVGGKVRGFDPSDGPLRVSLESQMTSAIEVPVGPDGSFEFPRVLPQNSYRASLVPTRDAASSPFFNVADKDVTGIEIVVPGEKEVRIVASTDDNEPLPVFALTLAGSGSTVTVLAKPERDGSFRAKLPTDERKLTIGSFPLGYVVKSATYKAVDVLKQPLKISADDADDLQVRFASDPSLPLGSLKGRITGLDPRETNVRLTLNSVTSFATFETTVGADGAFSFSQIPQGSYMPAIVGTNVSGFVTPSTVVVSGGDIFSVELAAPSGLTSIESPFTEEEPTGVVLTSLSGSRQDANESAAVAQLRTINTAEVTYLSTNHGNYGTIPDLIKAGFLDSRFNGEISGFTWSVIAAGSNYVAVAVPSSQSTGRYGYFSAPDAIIRYSTFDVLTPPRQGGKPVG